MSFDMIQIKNLNPSIILIALKDEINFIGDYAVVRVIAKHRYKINSKPFYLYGVINKNFEEVKLTEKVNSDGEIIECDYLKFNKSNKKIFQFGENDFIIEVVIETDYCNIVEYKHVRLSGKGKVKIISENIGEDITNPKLDDYLFKADNYIYDVLKGRTIYTQHNNYDNFAYNNIDDVKVFSKNIKKRH